MADDLAGLEMRSQILAVVPEVVDPHRGVDEHSPARASGAPAPRRFGLGIRAAQRRQPPRAVLANQGVKAGMDYRGLLAEAGQRPGPLQQRIVENECSSHMHEYVSFMHIRS